MNRPNGKTAVICSGSSLFLINAESTLLDSQLSNEDSWLSISSG